jgi:hypothetical protein
MAKWARNTRTVTAAEGIPIRLRRRRDGSVALTDHRGVVDAPTYQLPREHLFTYAWLLGGGAAVATPGPPGDDRTITLSLANATAVYRVTGVDEGDRGLIATLVEASAFDAPLVTG